MSKIEIEYVSTLRQRSIFFMRDLLPNEPSLFLTVKVKGYAVLNNSRYSIVCKLYSNGTNELSYTLERLIRLEQNSEFRVIKLLNEQQQKFKFIKLDTYIKDANLRLLGMILTMGQKFYYKQRVITVLDCDLEFGTVDYGTEFSHDESVEIPSKNLEFLNISVPEYPFNLVSDNEDEIRLFLDTHIKKYVIIKDLNNLNLGYVNVIWIDRKMPLLPECLRRDIKLIGISGQKCKGFENHLNLGVPSFEDRRTIVSTFLTKTEIHIVGPAENAADCRIIVKSASPAVNDDILVRTRGFSVGDLILLLQNTILETKDLNPEHILELSKSTKPANLIEVTSDLPKIFLSDMFGVDSIITYVNSTIIEPFKNPQNYSGFIPPPKGALIYGPTGSGKTMLATAIANETGLPCILVSSATLRSKVVGESEERIHKLFSKARTSAPVIILLENLEMICPARSHKLSQSDSRMVTTFLQEMDGIRHSNGVFILGITTDYETVDPAITRAGRIDIKVSMPMLDFDARLDILMGKLSGIENDLDLEFLKNLVQQDLRASQVCALLDSAILNAIRRDGKLLLKGDFADAQQTS